MRMHARIAERLFNRAYIELLPLSVTRGLARLRKSRKNSKPNILIACMPKSGSTHLAHWLSSLQGYSTGSLVPANGWREHVADESLFFIPHNSLRNVVYQHHMRFNHDLLRMCQENSTGIIVLTRNILDAAVSIHDHMTHVTAVWPMFNLTDLDWESMDEQQRYRYIAEFVMPWYVDFAAGWIRAAHSEGPSITFLTYSQVTGNLKSVHQALSDIGVFVTLRELEIARTEANKHDSRFNVGVAGRGVQAIELYPFLGERIESLISARPTNESETLRSLLLGS